LLEKYPAPGETGLIAKIKDYIENMHFAFRKQQDSEHIITKYTQRLDSNEVRDREFVLITKDNHTYYGQVNQLNEPDGIGTKMFDNNFIYQGMFERGQMTGIGLSRDQHMTTYLGEHKEGKREGKGIL
jgi:hypothetical protein